jgi:hypothetical protein
VKAPTPLELKAAVIVARATGVTCEPLDEGGGSRQLADFALIGTDGIQVGVLEVTTTTRQRRVAIQKQLAALDWEWPDLRFHWSVKTRDAQVDARPVHAALRRELPTLEQAGLVGTWIPSFDADGPALPGALAEVGVVQVVAYEAVDEGGVGYVSVGPTFGAGGFYSLDAFRPEAQGALNLRDNQLKLKAGGERSELFVWLDVGTGQVALSSVHTPPFDQTLRDLAAPSLPNGCTGVWVASPGGDVEWPASHVIFGDATGWHLVRSGRPLLPFTRTESDGGTQAR